MWQGGESVFPEPQRWGEVLEPGEGSRAARRSLGPIDGSCHRSIVPGTAAVHTGADRDAGEGWGSRGGTLPAQQPKLLELTRRTRRNYMENPYVERARALKLMGVDSYKSYLVTAHWRTIRKRVLSASPHCRKCGRTANTVHHMAYDIETMQGERDEALLSVCHKCHRKAERRYRGLQASDRLSSVNVFLLSPARHRVPRRRKKQSRKRLLHLARVERARHIHTELDEGFYGALERD